MEINHSFDLSPDVGADIEVLGNASYFVAGHEYVGDFGCGACIGTVGTFGGCAACIGCVELP